MKKLLTIILISLLLGTFAFAGNVDVLDLRGSSAYYRVADNGTDDQSLGTDYTIEGWIYIAAGERTITDRILHSQGWAVTIVVGSGGTGNATVRFAGTATGTINMTVPTEEWHHIAFQGNSAGWTNNYLDGLALQNAGASNIASSDYISVGSIGYSGTYNFNGAIEELRISNICRYARMSFSVSKNDAPFTSDANTVLLYHYDDSAIPPTNHSGMVFTTTNFGIGSGNYTAYDDASFTEEIPLPITLNSFTAEAVNGVVELAWETATETNNANFVIYRNDVAIASVAGAGTTSEPHTYTYTDETVVPGVTYTYVLADVDYANDETRYESDAVTVTIANDLVEAGFVIGAAYPNPFNPTTIVPLTLTKSADVHAALYDASGHELKVIMNSTLSAGTYSLEINGNDLSTGLYLVKITVDNVLNVRKISLMK